MSRPARRTSARPVAVLLLAFLAIVGPVSLTATPAIAVALPAAAVDLEPFPADKCAGETTNDPAEATGAVADLTQVFGQRLVDNAAGRTVILYGNDGSSSGTPNCSVHVDDAGNNLSEWIYCTDFASKTCSVTDAGGNLTIGGEQVGSLERKADNARLSKDQQQLISYVLRTDMPVTEVPYFNAIGARTASNATTEERSARQWLVWCISDRDRMDGANNFEFGIWCDANIGPAAQSKILAGMPDTPALTVTPASAETQPGEVVEVDVTTNLLNQPLAVNAAGAQVELCEASAGTLTDGVLSFEGDRPGEATAQLCVTSATAGEIALTVTAKPADSATLTWDQSPGNDNYVCQVYASFTKTEVAPVTAASTLTFRIAADATGGFSIAKDLTGDAANLVDDQTEFTVTWSIDGGEERELTLLAGAAATKINDLPEGSEVEIEEATPPSIDGVMWDEPTFTIDGQDVSTPATFTVEADTETAVTVTNTAVADDSVVDSDDATDDGQVKDDSASAGELPAAGTTASDLILPGVLLLAAGTALVVVARRRSWQN